MEYDRLREHMLAGGTDEEILEWCCASGHRLYKNDIEIWNGFISKLGWNDFASGHPAKSKAEAGLADREDIQTLGQLFEVEEGRKKRAWRMKGYCSRFNASEDSSYQIPPAILRLFHRLEKKRSRQTSG